MKKIGYTPVSIFAAGCGAIASAAALTNPATAPAAVGIGTTASAIAGGIELNDEERNIKDNLDRSLEEAWERIEKHYRLTLYTENCFSELKQEIMGKSTSVDEFVRNTRAKGFEPSIAIVIHNILEKHRDVLNRDPEIIWNEEYTERAAEEMASILVEAVKNVFEDDDQLRILKAVADSERTIISKIEDKGNQIIEEIRDQKNILLPSDTVDFSDYYDSVVEDFTEENDNSSVELLGRESDDKAYIDQFITVGFEQKPALQYLSDWFTKKKYGTLLICGEPGHGKSLLCKKAVVEYKRGRFLKGNAQNVLAISLNTGENPRIIRGKEVNFENMLAWGPIKEHSFSFEDCRGSLLFMDGFDEFIDEAKKANIKDIVSFMHIVERIAKEYNMHIVILSRSIAVQKELIDPEICNKSFQLSPITKEQQEEWVKERNDYCDYSETLIKLQNDQDMNVLLGIPLLFRMIVHTQYNKVSSNIVELYDGLFEHLMRKRRIRGAVLEKVRIDLSDHAYKVYCNDEDTAAVEAEERDENWVFAFYVRSGQGGNVGFFHRSFYQYFLARNVLFRILDVETDKQAENLIGSFAERELDDTARHYLSLLINEENKKVIHNSLSRAIEALVRTEAYLNLEPRYHDGNAEKTKLGRTKNIYRNILHISAAFSYVIEKPFRKGIDIFLRTYPSYCILICSTENKRADLSRANLRGADLIGADLIGADLSRVDLSGACLNRTNLSRANLIGANLSGSYLSRADLSEANLSGASLRGVQMSDDDQRELSIRSRLGLFASDLSRANLSEADLRGANLSRTNLSRANLIGAMLSGSDLSRANLGEASLREAYLFGANLSGANLSGADLRGADLSGADLSGAIMREVNLSKVDPKEVGLSKATWSSPASNAANLSRANLRGADLIGANLSGARLKGAILSVTLLIGADLRGADLNRADLSGAILRGANLSRANLRGANLSKAEQGEVWLSKDLLNESDLSKADLSRVNLSRANLKGARLNGVHLNKADLRGVDLSSADLRGAHLNRANLSGASLFRANLKGADFNEANLSRVDLSEADLEGTILSVKRFNYTKIDSDKKELIDPSIEGYETIVWVNKT